MPRCTLLAARSCSAWRALLCTASVLAAHGARCTRWCRSLQCVPRATDPEEIRSKKSRRNPISPPPAAARRSTLQGCLGLQPAARTVPGARSVARGTHCSDWHQRLHRAPCAASTLAVHSIARHALQLRAASKVQRGMRAARNSPGVRQRTLYAAGTLPLACSARRALGVRRRVSPPTIFPASRSSMKHNAERLPFEGSTYFTVT
jgi:hypothetical protein